MRYPVIKPPTRQEQALIRRKIKEVVKEQGGLRPAARHLKIKSSYLGSLLDGTKKTRAIGIFANSACGESLTLRKSDRLLFPKAVVQATRNSLNLRSAFGHKRPVDRPIFRLHSRLPNLVEVRFREIQSGGDVQ